MWDGLRTILGQRWTRNVMAPMTGVTVVVVLGGGWAAMSHAKDVPWFSMVVLGGIGVWLLFYFGAYLLHSIRNPKLLQSETYRLQEKQIAKGLPPTVDWTGADISNPDATPPTKQLPSGGRSSR